MSFDKKLVKSSSATTRGTANTVFKFHRWADSISYDNDKAFSVTVAIIENLESGKVQTADPRAITFLSEEESRDIFVDWMMKDKGDEKET